MMKELFEKALSIEPPLSLMRVERCWRLILISSLGLRYTRKYSSMRYSYPDEHATPPLSEPLITRILLITLITTTPSPIVQKRPPDKTHLTFGRVGRLTGQVCVRLP